MTFASQDSEVDVVHLGNLPHCLSELVVEILRQSIELFRQIEHNRSNLAVNRQADRIV